MSFKFNNSIVGGTFDHLHLGHKKLIDAAFKQSTRVTIGLATADLYKNKLFPNAIESFELRERNLNDYLFKKNYQIRSQIIPIPNIFGNTK